MGWFSGNKYDHVTTFKRNRLILARIPGGTYCSFKLLEAYKILRQTKQHKQCRTWVIPTLPALLFRSRGSSFQIFDQQCILTSNAEQRVLYSRCSTCLKCVALFLIYTNSVLGYFQSKEMNTFSVLPIRRVLQALICILCVARYLCKIRLCKLMRLSWECWSKKKCWKFANLNYVVWVC